MKVLLKKNMTLRFKDTKHKETCLPGFIRTKVGGTQNTKHLNKRGRIYHPYPILYSQSRESYFITQFLDVT
jgi:hypothetical protein